MYLLLKPTTILLVLHIYTFANDIVTKCRNTRNFRILPRAIFSIST